MAMLDSCQDVSTSACLVGLTQRRRIVTVLLGIDFGAL